MTDQNNMQKQDAGTCGPGCACGAPRPGGYVRMVVGIVVLVVAGVLVGRAVMKDNGSASASAAPASFAALPAAVATAPEATAVKPATEDRLKELESLSDLNTAAGDSFGVFVFLPGKGGTVSNAPITEMRSAARTIEPQLRGGKIGMFALKAGSPDYEQLTTQMAVPGVLAMVKGGGMSAASGDITEAKLVQALVAASSAGGCGAGGGGCAPGSCN